MHVSSETEDKDYVFKRFKVSIHFHSKDEARGFHRILMSLENLLDTEDDFKQTALTIKMIRGLIEENMNYRS